MAKKDFSINDLPSNRKEVFFDCLKIRFKMLVRCGISLFIYCIPLILCLVFKSIYIGNAQRMYAVGEITKEAYSSAIVASTGLFDLGIVVASLISTVGVCGVTRIIRQLSWEEHVFYKRDFYDGVKMNYKQMFKGVLIFAIIYALSDIALVSRIENEMLKILPGLVLSLLFVPVLLYTIGLINVYNIKFFAAFKNSILLFFKTALVSLLFSIIIYSTKFISLIPTVAPIIIYVVLLVVGLPILYLAWFLYASNAFDKYINKKNYPELVGKGTHPRNNDK